MKGREVYYGITRGRHILYLWQLPSFFYKFITLYKLSNMCGDLYLTQEIDQNGDGNVSHKEFREAMTSMKVYTE